MGDVSGWPMFGGYGLSIDRGRLYFRTDETSRLAYLDADMEPFRPNSRQTLKTHCEVPMDVIEDQDQLVAWAVRDVKS